MTTGTTTVSSSSTSANYTAPNDTTAYWSGRDVSALYQPATTTDIISSNYFKTSGTGNKRKAPTDLPQPNAKRLTSSNVKINAAEIMQALPPPIVGIVVSYVDSAGDLVELLRQGKDIPDYLQIHAKHINNLDLSSLALPISQISRILRWCRNLENLKLPADKVLNDLYLKNKIYNEGLLDSSTFDIFSVRTRYISDSEYRKNFKNIIISIADLPNLRDLDISKFIYIRDEFESIFFDDNMLELLTSGGRLQYLSINNCMYITNKGVFYIIDKCRELKRLEISHNPEITDTGIESLKGSIGLKHLNISGCHELTNASLQSIAELTGLESLNIGGLHVDDTGLQFLVCLCNLRSLVLCSTTITNTTISYIATLTKLEYLDLSNCREIDDESAMELQNLCNLKKLIIFETHVNPNVVEYLKSHLPNLVIENKPPLLVDAYDNSAGDLSAFFEHIKSSVVRFFTG